MPNLQWAKCDDHWCDLWTLDLSSIGTPFGVYIIWHGGQQRKCVCVGSGVIVAELAGRRVDPSVSEYLIHGLYVTWAEVPVHQQPGVVTYLSKHYNPLVASQFQDHIPLPINLPL